MKRDRDAMEAKKVHQRQLLLISPKEKERKIREKEAVQAIYEQRKAQQEAEYKLAVGLSFLQNLSSADGNQGGGRCSHQRLWWSYVTN